MNFLAHVHLSFGDPLITIGNFIADQVKANKFEHLPKRIQKGIFLHRHIDTFTDSHSITKQSSRRLHENYGHYSRVIVDIYYDHFLAKNWSGYSDIPIRGFVDSFYGLLEQHFDILPLPTQRMIPYMMADDWLGNYANLEGIKRVLEGMNRRTQNRSKMNHAINDLTAHYDKFEAEFTAFYSELITFSKQKFDLLCNEPL